MNRLQKLLAESHGDYLVEAKKIRQGDYVESILPRDDEGWDFGQVDRVSGARAEVRWVSGVTTWTPLSMLEVIPEREYIALRRS
jgi:hypothetical protein